MRLRNLGCTVIILSSTLTAKRRKSILGDCPPEGKGYPLLTGVRASGTPVVHKLPPPPPKTIRLHWLDASKTSPLSVAVKKARAGCNVLCIANTVATAQEWFRTLKTELCEDDHFPTGLLHAKFTGTDREIREKEWMARLGKPSSGDDATPRPRGSILVSTQIVEQSVDIDADWILSELAPIDMLLQRLGRLWRHDRPMRPVAEPELAVVCTRLPEDNLSDLSSDHKALESHFGRGCWVYAPYVLLRTLETLRHRDAICIPNDIRPLLETVYSDEIPSTDLHQSLHADMLARAERLRQLARMGQSDTLPTKNDDAETAGTRYSSRPSVSLLLLRDFDDTPGRSEVIATLLDGRKVSISRFHRDFEVTKAIYGNLVQVPPNDALRAEKATRESDLLSQHFFASETPFICLWDNASGSLHLAFTGADTGYFYTAEMGAFQIRSAGASFLRNSAVDAGAHFFFDSKNDW
jgi:CRISPR-associated endonuclease/helicase Cas3